jgi:sigma-B regulation protein RsbU (phosphoserine phosphatase)
VARPRVLVVDDDAAHRRAVERVLGAGHDVVAAPGASEALAAAAEERFDLAILDIRMPGMDGFALMAALKAADAELDVILMTGSASDTDARLLRAIRERAFYFLQKPFHREVLMALVGRCLESRRLARENALRAAHLAEELEAARRFQSSLFPALALRLPRVELAALYEPSLELGGDFLDHATLPGGGLALLVTDVAGKGAGAAMVTGMVKHAFHAAAADGYAPAAVVARVAGACRLFPGDRFLTAFAARIDPSGARLEYLGTAGHPPPFLRRAGGTVEVLEPAEVMIHPAFAVPPLEARAVAFEPGDLLVAYTDGLVEARRSQSDDWFGFDRVRAVVGEGPAADAGGDLARLRDALRVFQAGRPPDDDLTLVALRRR